MKEGMRKDRKISRDFETVGTCSKSAALAYNGGPIEVLN